MTPRFGHPVPVLRIFDENTAKEFYCGFLGFTVDWEHRFEDDLPLYLQVSQGDCILHLSEHHGDCCPGGALRIDIEDADGLRRILADKKYKFARPGIEETPYGTREIRVTDPFGNKLILSQTLTRPT